MVIPLHIQLLDLLSKKGIGVSVNISPFLSIHFKKPITDDKDQWNKEVRPSIVFLEDLIQYRNLIRVDDYMQDVYNVYRPYFAPHMNAPSWYDTNETNVYITSEGLDYLDLYKSSQINNELAKSYKDVNQASLKNYSIQKKYIVLTVFISAVAALFSAVGYFKPDPKTDELNRSIQSMSQEVKTLRQQLLHSQSQKNNNGLIRKN